MRVLVVTQYFWPEDFRINELVAHLVSRGHEITVLTGTPNYPEGRVFPDFKADPIRFSSYRGAAIVRIPILPRGRGAARLVLNYLSYPLSASVLGLAKLRRRHFDAIFIFEPSPITVALPALIFRRLRRIPAALWVLDQWPETLAAVGAVRSPPLLRAMGRFVSSIYARCDLILSPSKSLTAAIARYAPSPHRIRYFPNWAESSYGGPTPEPAPEVPPCGDCFNVMFAGNIGESQDFPAILDAAGRLAGHTHIRWLIVGDGRMAAWVSDEVKRRQLEGRVLLLGRYPPERMLSFYSHAHALLVSLKSEPIFAMTLPGKIQSYLAAGIPVIGMLDGEGARIIEEADAGIACPAGDAERLAEAVLRLSRLSAGERRAMGERGRAYCRREFDRDMLLTRLESWMTEMQTQA